MMAPPIETTIIKEVKPKDELPPPPPPEMEHPPVQVVAPEITINISADIPPPPITQVTTNVVPPQPPRPRVVVPDTLIGPISIPNPEDMYPERERAAGHEGRPMISFCTDDKGKLTSAEVGTSSGFPLLDEAAVKLVRLGRFRAATKDGKPISSCIKVPIKFKLNKG
jgi:protein TonB